MYNHYQTTQMNQPRLNFKGTKRLYRIYASLFFFFIIVLLNNTKAQKVIPDKSASFLNNCIHPKQQDTASRLQRNTAYTCLLAVGYALTFMFRINICTLPTRHYNPSCVNICHTVESTANYTSTFRLCCLCNTFIKIKTRFNDKFEI